MKGVTPVVFNLTYETHESEAELGSFKHMVKGGADVRLPGFTSTSVAVK